MHFELFVSLRYLLARRKQAFISVISLISVLGVAIGVASLIVVLGVMNGFSDNLRDKILGINSHLILGSVKQTIDPRRRVGRKRCCTCCSRCCTCWWRSCSCRRSKERIQHQS